MLVEDTAAFIERLEIQADEGDRHRRRMTRADLDVRTAQWEVHLAASAALEVERLIGLEHSPRRARSLERELGSIRRHLHSKRDELAASLARLDRLEAKARERAEHRRPHTTFRLHSNGYHVDCSVKRFVRLSATQLERPTYMLRYEARTWWWYLNRSWWDSGGLRPRVLAETVLRSDLERMLAADTQASARLALVGESATHNLQPVPDSLHLSVWSRHRGRCVDCGSVERVNFDRILATSRPSSETPRNFELRCQACRYRRDHNEARTRVGRARVDASLHQRFG